MYKYPKNTRICGIYKITNKIDNKTYIGQSVDIMQRWIQHWSMTYRVAFDPAARLHMYFAMRKYGIDKFKFEIIELSTPELLNEREQFWIDTIDPEYNTVKIIK